MKELGRQGRKSVRSLPQLAHYSKMGNFKKEDLRKFVYIQKTLFE
jgi:hypothetical protein